MSGENKIDSNRLRKLNGRFQKLQKDLTEIRHRIEELIETREDNVIKLSPEVVEWMAGKISPPRPPCPTPIHDWSCFEGALPPEINIEELLRQVGALEKNVEVFTKITEQPLNRRSKKTKR